MWGAPWSRGVGRGAAQQRADLRVGVGAAAQEVAGDAVVVGAGGHQRARRLAVQALAAPAGQVVADRAGDEVVGEARAAGAAAARRPPARRAAAPSSSSATSATAATTWRGAPSPITASASTTARSRGESSARRARTTVRAIALSGAAPPVGRVERAHAMVGDLAAELAQQPRVAGRRAMALAADLERRRRRRAADEPRRATTGQRLGVQHRRRAGPADEAEQVRGRVGIVGTGADGDEQGQVGDPPRQVGEHLQRRPVGPVRVVDHEHERRLVGQGRAQPQHAVGDRHGGVGAGHRPVAQQGAGRGRRPLEQARPPLVGPVAQRSFQQRAHHPEAEMALERARRGAAHAAAGPGRLLRGVLEQRGLAEPGGRREDDDRALAVGQPRHRVAQDVELARALDEQRLGAARRRLPGPDDVQVARIAAAARARRPGRPGRGRCG